jgi:hypothetical protein
VGGQQVVFGPHGLCVSVGGDVDGPDVNPGGHVEDGDAVLVCCTEAQPAATVAASITIASTLRRMRPRSDAVQ